MSLLISAVGRPALAAVALALLTLSAQGVSAAATPASGAAAKAKPAARDTRAAPGSASAPAAPAAAAAAIPRLANGHPDFSGIWQTTSAADYGLEPHGTRRDAPPSPGVVEGGTIPYLPKALEQRRKNFEARHSADPRLKCYTLGVPRGVYYPEPFQILQRAQDLTLLAQFGHSARTIHTNGTPHPANPNDWWLGDSRASWDGDTLVVDVRHFNDDTWLDRSGNFHSDALHVVERWRYLDANTIAYRATLEDPQVYSRPWSLEVLLHRHREPGFQLVENYCQTLDYAEHYPPKPPASASAPAAAQPK